MEQGSFGKANEDLMELPSEVSTCDDEQNGRCECNPLTRSSFPLLYSRDLAAKRVRNDTFFVS